MSGKTTETATRDQLDLIFSYSASARKEAMYYLRLRKNSNLSRLSSYMAREMIMVLQARSVCHLVDKISNDYVKTRCGIEDYRTADRVFSFLIVFSNDVVNCTCQSCLASYLNPKK